MHPHQLPSNRTILGVSQGVIFYPAEYNLTYEFPFERDFNPIPPTIYMQRYWTLSIWLSVLYVFGIYAGRHVMKHRQAFDLNTPLTCWNAALAVFSIMGAVRMFPEFYHVLTTYGFEYSMCNASFAMCTTSSFWTTMFALSKVVEFGDTAFIVLRKRPVIFLHWYHHITVLVYTWHAFKDHTAAGRWFQIMNFTVHAFMYSYYALRSIGSKFPKFVPMLITVMQLMQMIIGCIIGANSYRIKSLNDPTRQCQQTYENLYFNCAIYFSYFLLFANYFYQAYMTRGGKHNKVPNDTAVTKKVD